MFYYVRVNDDNEFINLEDEISTARMLGTGWKSEDALEDSLAGDGWFRLDEDGPAGIESLWETEEGTRYAIVRR